MQDDKIAAMMRGIQEAVKSGRMRKCKICGCRLHAENGTYARPSVQGRSHATKHHYIPERFFGRSKNRPATKREGIFDNCPWGFEGQREVFCYECHEELLHNPVLLPEDIEKFATLVRARRLDEATKTSDRAHIAGRIMLFHDVISRGLDSLLADGSRASGPVSRSSDQ